MAKKKAQRKRVAVAAQPVDSLVIYVHGIGRHLPHDDLKLEWDLALFGRDRGAATRMAYWSDVLHPSSAKARQSRRASDDLSPDAILAEAGLAPSNIAARNFARDMVRAYGFDDAGRTNGFEPRALPLPSVLREPISRAFLKQFIADAAAYFFESKKRTAIRKRLSDVLPGTEQDVTVVAHSLGSVVALEVLAKTPRLSVRKLVTIGSPLGIREVQDFLELPPGDVPFEIPRCIEQWDNFADPLDPVALDKGLANEFTAAPTAPHVSITDQIIVNRGTRRLRGFNPHSAAGYLSHPKVRRSVYEATHFDTLTRFVVARDVAEALGRDERHPVLIEVLEPGYPAVGEDPARCAARERTAPLSQAARVAQLAADLETLVKDAARGSRASVTEQVKAAQIDELRRFVAAHLNADELRLVADRHRDFNVYAVWSSAVKKKLIDRSRTVLQADAALESYQATGARIRWAVLDTGVRSTHPHFVDARTGESRVTAVWDCTKRGKPQNILGTPREDRDGHGSHVAGIIAGRASHDGKTYSGIAPEAALVVYKVLDDRGDGEDAWIIKALDHIAEQNENNATTAIHGLNLSLGGPYDATVYGCGFTPICQELRRLWRSGVLVVVACGNEGQLEVQTREGDVEINTPMSIGDPANLEDCIAVGSVNADRPHLYGISAFSSRGPTSDGRWKPDVVAPGERITSVNARFRGNRNLYRVDSGTSMAAPHVSGLLAAFLSVRREFIGRPDEVKRILLDNCTDIGRERQHQGRGIPNLMKMLLSV